MAANRRRASEHDPAIEAIVLRAHEQGASLRAIARALNELHVPTPRGGSVWQATSVARIVDRAEPSN